jgi:hypothetical protein
MNGIRRRTAWALVPALVLGLLVGLGGSPANAVPGDSLAVINRPANCGGIGVAFDGTDVLYTCGSEDAVRKTDLAGNDNGTVPTTDPGGAPLSVDAIAWDPDLNVLWGGELADTDNDGNNDTCNIWSIDMSTGVGTLAFSFIDVHGGCDFFFFDGITVDTVTDTLWLSPDVHQYIHHYTKAGAEIAADLIDFGSLTPTDCGGGPCPNSGLAIGLDGNLFAGTAGFGKIFQIDPGPPAMNLGQFSTVTGRDEDLECGPRFTKPDGSTVETILSADLESVKIDVLEAPEGTCQSPVEPGEIRLDPPKDVNPAGTDHTVTATVTSGGAPQPGVQVTFAVISGPNTGQTSGPGECSSDPNCVTDANGQTSWTYTSNGVPGQDVIEACFVDETGARRCARATKDWERREVQEGRMTGGGSVFTEERTRVTHGFQLHCDETATPNNLQINWGKGNRFHLDMLTSASCFDDPAIAPEPPPAGFDTYEGEGTGSYNGIPGATAEWTFTDAGEPGEDDTATLVVRDALNNVVLTVSGPLEHGNHQAHAS